MDLIAVKEKRIEFNKFRVMHSRANDFLRLNLILSSLVIGLYNLLIGYELLSFSLEHLIFFIVFSITYLFIPRLGFILICYLLFGHNKETELIGKTYKEYKARETILLNSDT